MIVSNRRALLGATLGACIGLTLLAQTQTTPETAAWRFLPFGQRLPASGQWREGFRVADLNGDGHPDIVHGAARKSFRPPVIFLGDGKGNWSRWKEAKFPPLPYDYGDVDVADFNRDGHPDLALAIHMRGLQVLLGDGHGNFKTASEGLPFADPNTPGFSSRAVRALDWNGDGLPDLVAVWEGPRPTGVSGAHQGVAVFLNQGAKGWSRGDNVWSPGLSSDALALGDFDGDGHLDVVTGSNAVNRKDLVNFWAKGGAVRPASLDVPGTAHYVMAVTAGDFDNDGRADVAVGYVSLEHEAWFVGLDVFFARDGGKWERRILLHDLGREGIVALATGHLRGPKARTRDLVALSAHGETIVFLGDGHGSFSRVQGVPIYDGGCRGAHVELADLDGDGRDEIVAAFADEQTSILPGSPVCGSNGGITAWKMVPAR